MDSIDRVEAARVMYGTGSPQHRAAALRWAPIPAPRTQVATPTSDSATATLASLLLDLAAPEVLEALAARDVAQAASRTALQTYEAEARRSGRRTRQYLRAFEEADGNYQLAQANLTRAVRKANPRATQAAVEVAARNL